MNYSTCSSQSQNLIGTTMEEGREGGRKEVEEGKGGGKGGNKGYREIKKGIESTWGGAIKKKEMTFKQALEKSASIYSKDKVIKVFEDFMFGQDICISSFLEFTV